jgi:hypothetical protein
VVGKACAQGCYQNKLLPEVATEGRCRILLAMRLSEGLTMCNDGLSENLSISNGQDPDSSRMSHWAKTK